MAAKVSFVMGVYNGEAYLKETMESILAQTFTDWECIAIDDCSSDRTPEILARYASRDARVKVYRNDPNLRLPSTLNRGLKLAQGEYVVRMDADDICRPDRLEHQVAFMDAHPELAMSSCKAIEMMPGGDRPAVLQRRTEAPVVGALFLFFEPIVHPGVIARRKDMLELMYDPVFTCTEDLELWTRMLRSGKQIAIIDEYLLKYRIHEKQITSTMSEKQKLEYSRVIRPFYREMLFELSDEEVHLLEKTIYYREEPEIARMCAFVRKVFKCNREKGKFDQKAIMYAAFELVMSCRAVFDLSAAQKIMMFSLFPPVFTVKELLRRKTAAARGYRALAADAHLWDLNKK